MRDWDNRSYMILAFCVGLPILFLLLPPTQPTMLATMGVFAHAVLWLMDCAMGSVAFGISPVLMWSVLGAIIGACLGFWSVAPAVGRRRYRRIAGMLPIVMLGTLFVGDLLFSLSQSPQPAPLVTRNIPQVDPSAAKKPEVVDPNNEPAPGLYSIPKEEILSTAPEGGGGDPRDRSVVPMDNAGIGVPSNSQTGSDGSAKDLKQQQKEMSNNPVDRLNDALRGGNGR